MCIRDSSSIPLVMYEVTLSCCLFETIGPQRIDSSSGSPTEYLAGFADIVSMTSSRFDSGTSSLLRAEHSWPELLKQA